ncbi:hypothetical protein [Brevibacillus dissolubilis]|uniref:hypothetical protein n=1 Tax=Brevibacillus dissolubilis TaxID=1844116 RepID=UPI001115BC61|nr:hypothetical protein [Brevibacillus dissolubilis]
MEGQKVDYHLQQAFAHLREALQVSIGQITNNASSKNEIGQKWETFLREFFGMIKAKGKESKINLLSLVSVTKLWR